MCREVPARLILFVASLVSAVMEALPRERNGHSISNLEDVQSYIEEAAGTTTALEVKIGNKRSMKRKNATQPMGQKMSLVSGGLVKRPVLPSR